MKVTRPFPVGVWSGHETRGILARSKTNRGRGLHECILYYMYVLYIIYICRYTHTPPTLSPTNAVISTVYTDYMRLLSYIYSVLRWELASD